MSKLGEVEQDPLFVKLSYEEQLQVRAKALEVDFSFSDSFNKLRQNEKLSLYNKLLYRPPKLENPHAVRWDEIMRDMTLTGNSNAMNEGLFNLAIQSLPENSVLVNLANRVLGTAVQIGGGPQFASIDRDRKKFLKYLDYSLSKDERYLTTAGLLKTASGIVGFGIDILPAYATLIGSYSKAKGLARFFMEGFKKTFSTIPRTSLGLKLTGKYIPAALHSAAGGIIGVAREQAKDFLTGAMQKQGFLKTLSNTGKYFTEYALGDMAAFTIGGALKTVFPHLKGVFGKGTRQFMKTTYDDFVRVSQQALANEPIDKVLIARLMADGAGDLVQVVKSQQSWARVMHHVERASKTDLMKAVALKSGFVIGDDFIVKRTLNPDVLFKGKNIDDAGKYVLDQLSEVFKPDKATMGALLSSGGKGQIIQKIKGVLKDTPDNLVKAVAEAITPRAGKYEVSNVQTFVKGLLRGSGAADDIVKKVNVRELKETIKVTLGKTDLVEFPKFVISGGEETNIVKEILDSLSPHLGETVDDLKLENFMKVYRETFKKKPVYSPSWVDNTMNNLGGTMTGDATNGFDVVIPGKEKVHFKNYEDVGNHIVKSALTEESFAGYLGYYHKAQLHKTKAGDYMIIQGRKKFGKGQGVKNFEELIDLYPQFFPKIPSHLGPKAAITKRGVEMTYTLGALEGDYVYLVNELAKFVDIGKRSGKIAVEGADILKNLDTGMFEMYLPSLEYRESFKSLKDLRKSMKKGMDDFHVTQQRALSKGHMLDFEMGHYVMRGEDGVKHIAQNTDELEKIFRDIKIPEWAPEISGLEAALKTMGDELPEGLVFKPLGWIPENPKGIDWKWHFGNLGAPPDRQFRVAVQKTGDETFLKFFDEVQLRRRGIEALTHPHFQAIESLFTEAGGKGLISPQNRRYLYWVAQYGDGIVENMLPKKWGPERIAKWKDEFLPYVDRIRKYFGETPGEGLFKYFGVNPRKFIYEYMPQLYRYVKDKLHRLDKADGEVMDLVKEAFQGRVPGGIDVFFKHLRVSDVKTLSTITDPLELFRRYVVAGIREEALGDVFERAVKYIHSRKAPSEVAFRFESYLADVMGMPSRGMQELSQITDKVCSMLRTSVVGKKVIKDKDLPTNLLTAFTSWSYPALIGFRPWLAARNMQQIWTTLAPRIGNSYVYQALIDVANDPKIYEMLVKRGVIKSKLPVAHAETIKLGKIGSKSLTWFRNSDDFTRAIAYRASELRFDEAVKQFRHGRMKPEHFVEMSGMLQMETGDLAKAMKFINNKQGAVAKDLFANSIVRDTMFPYQSGMGTSLFQGAVGHAFGRFGHYPLYYVANIRRGMSNAAKNWKALTGKSGIRFTLGYASKFLGNSFSLFGAFAALGITANNFLPWVPAMFGGGPTYNLMNDALKALMDKGYEGRQQRAKLFAITQEDGKVKFDIEKLRNSGLVTNTVPGALYARSFFKAIEALNEGDYYRAILNFGSMPVRE